uniref:NADH-ubiquinone oxidoreductase chain 2 n=1 Tax=Etrocorema hochii TaxID=2684660 RepID=A0A6B9PMR5_9NEOP|nr:NADH dehydrogenase subunit 2 [Etrocorema hochii]
MLKNSSNLLFYFTLFLGTMISISSNSWFGAWMGLEINLLSFIPLIVTTPNLMSTEASLKYFLTQALASISLILMIIISSLSSMIPFTMSTSDFILSSMINSTLFLKMGAAPFHFWFPGVIEGLSWINSFILMTWQKIAPMILLTFNLSLNSFSILVILISIMIGSLGGLNQTSLRKILAYSSISHLGWMIPALNAGENIWEIYFAMYTFMTAVIVFLLHTWSISHINQNFAINSIPPFIMFSVYTSLLSLGGLPPFIGFLPKWTVIQTLTQIHSTTLITLMVITTLITLFFYLRISFSAFLFTHNSTQWNTQLFKINLPYILAIILTCISTLGLIMSSTLIFNLL